MNKKGYTIIELIITISLIAIIGVAVSINLNHLSKKDSYAINEEYISEIKSAANYYATNNKTLYQTKEITITVKDLIDEGLLNTSIYNGSNIKEDDIIKITLDDNGLIIINYPV